MNGLEIVQAVYKRLRMPADTALPYQTVLDIASGVIRKKKLDLSLSEQNAEARTSQWFRPHSTDFELSTATAELADVLFPIRVERRPIYGTYETGEEVPIVNYQVLQNHHDTVAFYGTPIRMAFHNTFDYTAETEYRVVYEEDFSRSLGLDNKLQLPAFFSEMVIDETVYKLLPLVEDNTDEWTLFFNRMMPVVMETIKDWRFSWERFIRNTHGNRKVFKKTFGPRRLALPRHRPRGPVDV
jgi:hypothetical protein